MELRPVAVLAPEGTGSLYRRYAFLRGMTASVKDNTKGLAHGKLKELREAIQQGELETEYYLREKRISALLDYVFLASYDSDEKRNKKLRTMMENGVTEKEGAFFTDEEKKRRSLLFDAIEISDHFELLREVRT